MLYQTSALLNALHEVESAAIQLRQFAARNLRTEDRMINPWDESHIADLVEITQDAYLKVSLPVMMPKRSERDSAKFLDGPLLAAIRTYFTDKPIPKYSSCVLVYEHIYAADRPRRRVTDHDNFELKHVQDILESAFLANDTSALCSAFQCSHKGKSDSTCIWILTPEQFPEWLSAHTDSWKPHRKSEENP